MLYNKLNYPVLTTNKNEAIESLSMSPWGYPFFADELLLDKDILSAALNFQGGLPLQIYLEEVLNGN